MANIETATWPERFVYVCSASQAAIVNALPLVQAGFKRIAEIVVLCGAIDPQTRDPRQLRDAIEPTRELERIISEWSRGTIPPRVRPLYGDASRIGDWTARVRQILDENAEAPKIPVVYNISGGTRQMVIGALYGCVADAGRTEKHLLQVVGAPLRSELIDLDSNTETPLDRGGLELSLGQYLELYGVSESNPTLRGTNEQFFEANREATERFASVVLPRAPIIAPVLAQATAPLFPNPNEPQQFRRGVIDPWESPIGRRTRSSSDAAAALLALDGIAGLRKTVRPDGKPVMEANRRDGAMLVRSQWLEAVLFNRVKQKVGHLPHVSIAATVPLRLRSGSAQDDLGEIDVAVMIHSQLHIIEAKFASFGRLSRKSGEQSIAQLEGLKRQLMGQYGRVIAVNPRETVQTLSRAAGAFPDRARRAGIDLLLGPAAIDDAVTLIARLAA